MSFAGKVNETKRYLEAKYDVDLRDVAVERSFFSLIPLYNSNTKKAHIPHVNPLILIINPLYAFATKPLITHELTHAVSRQITTPEYSFGESLSIHEQTKNPYVTRFERFAYGFFSYTPFGLIARVSLERSIEYRGWDEIFRWMDDDNREERIERVKNRLCEIGSDYPICTALSGMRPRQFVEEHRLLRGLQRYLRDGDEIHIEKSREDFLRHGGNAGTAGKYLSVVPRQVY